jgi:hypothetical protein
VSADPAPAGGEADGAKTRPRGSRLHGYMGGGSAERWEEAVGEWAFLKEVLLLVPAPPLKAPRRGVPAPCASAAAGRTQPLQAF